MVHMPILISKDLWSNLQSGAGSSHERVQESIQELQLLLRHIDSFIDSYKRCDSTESCCLNDLD